MGRYESSILAGVALAMMASPVQGQEAFGTGEAHAYPAGLIGRAGLGTTVSGVRLSLMGGYNRTDRRDWGEHEHEEGGGPGLGLRITREGSGGSGVYGELRLDVWFLEVNWRDPGPRRGSTEVQVIQPSVGAGYGWSTGMGRIRVGAALGWELNTRVRGEDVGEGPILMAGVGLDVGRWTRR